MTEPAEYVRSTEKEPKTDGWVWFNKDPAFPKAPISVLALAETVIVTLITAYIALRFGTLHLTIGAIVAPMLLLRTNQSTEVGLATSRSLLASIKSGMDRIDELDTKTRHRTGYILTFLLYCFCLFVVFPLSIGMAALLARVFAIARTVVRMPIRSLGSIPQNWWRTVSGVDSTSRIEGVPGASGADISERGLDVTEFLGGYSIRTDPGISPFIAVYCIVVALPALLYRYSLKGTALLYSPLVYLAHSSFRGPAGERLESLRRLAFHKVMRVYAVLVLVLFVGKVYLWTAWDQLQAAWQQIPSVEIISAYVVPEAIAPWHLASAITAAMTWGIYFFADAMLFKFRNKPPEALEASAASSVIRFLWFVRGILSLYTIACVVYITASLVPSIDWPPLGANLFPWSAR